MYPVLVRAIAAKSFAVPEACACQEIPSALV
jgi:hypothetical protein